MKQMRIKAIISSLLIPCFLILAISGAVLFFGKTGMIMGFARHSIRNAHAITALFMCILIPVHFFLNRRIYKTEVRALGKKSQRHQSPDK